MVVYAINPPQAWLFQLANALLFASYVIPSLLALRVLLAAAAMCFMLWGWLILPFSIDTVLWNAVFLLINTVQACIILWRQRPVSLDADQTRLYDALFSTGKGSHSLSRGDFKRLTSSAHNVQVAPPMSVSALDAPAVVDESAVASSVAPYDALSSSAPLCYIREYPPGAVVAAVGAHANTLSVILQGQLVVEAAMDGDILARGRVPEVQQDRSSWRAVALLHELDFLDSPEWVARTTQRRPLYSVQIRVHSSGGARVLHWNAAALDSFLASNAHIQGVLLGVVGVDLARKVFSANVDHAELERELRGERGAKSAERIFHTLSPDIRPPSTRPNGSFSSNGAPAHDGQQELHVSVLPQDVASGAVSPSSITAAAKAPAPLSSRAAPATPPSPGGGRRHLATLLHLTRGTQDRATTPRGSLLHAHREWCALSKAVCTCAAGTPPIVAASPVLAAAVVPQPSYPAHAVVLAHPSPSSLAAPQPPLQSNGVLATAVLAAVSNTCIVHLAPEDSQ